MTTISQALRKIKKIKGEIAALTSRAQVSNSYLQEAPPVYSFTETNAELEKLKLELTKLDAAIAMANATTEVTLRDGIVPGNKCSLFYCIRFLQELKGSIQFYKTLNTREGSFQEYESTYDENTGRHVQTKKTIVYVATLAEKARDLKVKELEDLFEEVNNVVETANHRTDLKGV